MGHWRVCPHKPLAASWFLFLFSAALMRAFYKNSWSTFFFFANEKCHLKNENAKTKDAAARNAIVFTSEL